MKQRLVHLSCLALLALPLACKSSKNEPRTGDSKNSRSAQAPRSAKSEIKFEGDMSTPAEARVDLSAEVFRKIDNEGAALLFRYLAGNPRWEIREERDIRYAIRKEAEEGAYETTLNGFYSSFENEVMLQTRVMLSFEKAYGFGREYGNITRTRPGNKASDVIVEGEHNGSPGNSSYLIVDTGPVFLEIFDQAPELQRRFTQKTIDEVSAELSAVLAHEDEILKSGMMALPAHYPVALPDEAEFAVQDGVQPGIYKVTAAANASAPGVAYLKVFRDKDGERLSAARMTPKSTRHLGWSRDATRLFLYSSEVTVYEGDWSSAYEARFELWHRAEGGAKKKLAELTRTIHGWQH